jgi:chromosomal replication initiator protein
MRMDNALARYFSSPDYLDQPVISGRRMPNDKQIAESEARHRKQCTRGSERLLAAMAKLTGQDVPRPTPTPVPDCAPVEPRDAFQIVTIQAKTAEHFYIDIAEMTSDRRFRAVARPRQVAMYLCQRHTPYSLAMIGRRFGGRDHTTVIHAIKAVEKLRLSDDEFDQQVRALEARL